MTSGISDGRVRCAWAQGEAMVEYHDTVWGRPVHDDRVLFEFLLLEGAQAGLSWSIILAKRENYRRAFAGFDPVKVAEFGEDRIAALLQDEGIVRNRLKVRSAVGNARAFLEVQEEFGSFDAYIWEFVGGETIRNTWRNPSDLPASTPESDRMSRDLKRRGFKFAGSTICYAFMQATGMVHDHTTDCFLYGGPVGP